LKNNQNLSLSFGKLENLNLRLSKRLMRIANEFLDGLEIGATMEDLRFTGSLANYNWSKYSDIDLHIVVDFSKIDENTKLVRRFFLWRHMALERTTRHYDLWPRGRDFCRERGPRHTFGRHLFDNE
jgi:hypothetical protein